MAWAASAPTGPYWAERARCKDRDPVVAPAPAEFTATDPPPRRRRRHPACKIYAVLTLSAAQMTRLEHAAFRARVAEQLQYRFTENCRVLGPRGVHQAIEAAIEKAAGYGITEAGPTADFIDLVFALGPEFDHAYDWAAPILAESTTSRPKVDRLHAAAVQYLDQATHATEEA